MSLIKGKDNLHCKVFGKGVERALVLAAQPEGGGRGAGTPLYKLYRYVLPHRVWFLRRFGLKTGKNFGHFGLESGWFLRELRECMNVFIVSIPNE